MVARPKVNGRDKAAEKAVVQLVKEFPDKLDFYDVVNMVPKRSAVFKEEAKAALVHMINDGELIESPNRTIRIAARQ